MPRTFSSSLPDEMARYVAVEVKDFSDRIAVVLCLSRHNFAASEYGPCLDEIIQRASSKQYSGPFSALAQLVEARS